MIDSELHRLYTSFSKLRGKDEITCLHSPCYPLFSSPRRLEDSTPLSAHLRLRGSMLNHHMPWGYGALFEGHGADPSEVDLSVLRANV